MRQLNHIGIRFGIRFAALNLAAGLQSAGIGLERARRRPPGFRMRSGSNRRILGWRRIRVHSAGRYGHEAPVGRLGARKHDRARGIPSHNNMQEETWHA